MKIPSTKAEVRVDDRVRVADSTAAQCRSGLMKAGWPGPLSRLEKPVHEIDAHNDAHYDDHENTHYDSGNK